MRKKQKQRLREEMTARREALPEQELQAADREIRQRVMALPEYQSAETLFLFIGVGKEVDTLPLIRQALTEGRTICVPQCIGKGIMSAKKITGETDLKPAAFGLMEPTDACPTIAPPKIDFAVIPCLTCDFFGNRLGYGGGYYDRYLKKMTGFTVAVCREGLLSERVPRNRNDVRVQALVTEKRTLYFEKKTSENTGSLLNLQG